MTAWIRFVLKNRRLVLTSTLILTGLLLLPLRSLRVIIDPDEALPQTHPYVLTNNEIEKVFHQKFSAIAAINVKSGSIFEEKNLEKIRRITSGFKKIPGVVENSIISITSENANIALASQKGPGNKSLAEISRMGESALSKALDTAPAYSGLLYSKDKKTAQIIAEFKKVPEGFLPVDTAIRKLAQQEADENTEVWIGGVPAFLSLLEKFSQRMGFLFPLAILMIGLIHYEAFRTIQALILPLATALFAVVWAVGILGLSGQAIDVFNAATPILILAIAAGHAVQILKRYYEEYHAIRASEPSLSAAQANEKAVYQSIVKVGPVMLAACIVAALGFFSLIIFEIKSIQVFGIFTGCGILSALILELTFIPALRSLLPPPGEKESAREKSETIWDRIVNGFYQFVLNKRSAIYIGFSALALLSIYDATHVKIDNSQKSYFYGKLPERQQDDAINNAMAGTNTIFLVIDTTKWGGVISLPILSGMEKIQKMIEEEKFVGKTLSLADLFKHIRQAVFGGNPKEYRLPQSEMELNMMMLGLSADGSDKLLGNFIEENQNLSLLHVFVKNDRTEDIDALAAKIREESKKIFPQSVEVRIGGSTAGGMALNEVMIREKILNIVQIMAAVFIVSAIVFRSIMAGILILVPLIAAVLANFGVMGLFGLPLQIATALVSAMAVGIGADYGIYLSYRLREELAQKSLDEAAAFRKAFASAGKATLFVSVAVAGGFSILMLSVGFMVHFWMGLLIAVAMLVSAITALTLFPALILSLRPKFIYKDRK